MKKTAQLRIGKFSDLVAEKSGDLPDFATGPAAYPTPSYAVSNVAVRTTDRKAFLAIIHRRETLIETTAQRIAGKAGIPRAREAANRCADQAMEALVTLTHCDNRESAITALETAAARAIEAINELKGKP